MPDRFPIDHPQTEDWFEAWRQYNYYYGHPDLPPEPTDQHPGHIGQTSVEQYKNPYDIIDQELFGG